MKSNSFILLILCSFIGFSCSDNLTEIGSSIIPQSAGIETGCDIFPVTSMNVQAVSLVRNVASNELLLGSYYDSTYGTINADILTQLQYPVGKKFPKGSVIDTDSTAKITLEYTTIGESKSPIVISLYEINKKELAKGVNYPSNVSESDFCDMSVLIGQKTITANQDTSISKNSYQIVFKVDENFAKRFADSTIYKNDSAFNKAFKGLYIKTNLGSSTILKINSIKFNYYYKYKIAVINPTGGTTTVERSDKVIFTANSEVVRINRFMQPDKEAIFNKLQQVDSINVISSPANIQTEVTLPLASIKKALDKKNIGKKSIINQAELYVEVLKTNSKQPYSHLLLIEKKSMADFFKPRNTNSLPNNTTEVLGEMKMNADSTVYYSFNISKLIATKNKETEKTNLSIPEDMIMRIVPVTLSTDESGSITNIYEQNSLTGVTIRSGKAKKSPMSIKLVYSGL